MGVAGIAIAWSVVVTSCVLGAPEDPGCSEDAECGGGYSCRAGACFRETSGATFVPVDAGDDANADAE
jgi:hypothetical protein